MESTRNSDYFRVIEEQIRSNNMVTFKWLSRKLQIHNSVAKELLQEFLLHIDNGTKYAVTFVLYGKKTNGDILLSLVEEKNLAVLKNDTTVVDKHIYSIQLTDAAFDSNVIYNMDKTTHELQQLNLSSIKFNKEPIRRNIATQSNSNSIIESQKTYSTDRKMESKAEENPPEKNAFDKGNIEINGKGSSKKIGITKPIAKNKGSISCFFQKQAAKGNTKVKNSDAAIASNLSSSSNNSLESNNDPNHQEKASNSTINSDSSKKNECSSNIPESTNAKCIKMENNDSLPEKIEKSAIPFEKTQNISESISKTKKKKSKKTNKRKKMKRIILQSDSSSNSDASEDESRISEPELEEEPETCVEHLKKDQPAVIIAHGKKRKRKVVEKNLMDEDGYLHTSKEVVYESCSSDEDDNGVSTNNENVDNNKRLKTDEKDKDVDEKMPTDANLNKIRIQKTKQSSLMSFFGKSQKT